MKAARISSEVGNQLPILLIDFYDAGGITAEGWESVTNPLDRLLDGDCFVAA